MKPKLLIDAIALLSPLTGIGRYTYEIAKELQDKEHFECSYFYGYSSKTLLHPSKPKDIKRLKSIIQKSALLKKIARKLLLLSSKLFTPSYDLYWQPNFIPNNTIKAKKKITTVHDFSFLLHKEYHPKERIEYFEKYFFSNIIKSDIIITGSEFTKQEILERLDFAPEQIKVIYHGIDHQLFRVYKPQELELHFDLPPNFILSVGSIEPRKNLIGLLKAYNLLDQDIKERYKLVLVGFKGWQNQEIIDLIQKNKQNIHYLGFVSDQDLAKIYNLASAFVFASFYEGFGLPLLEAMACATPVISSHTSSLPEVGADAVLYCDPHSIQDIKDKITELLSNPTLQQDLAQKGLQRAQEFSWQKSANQHQALFQTLAML